MWVVLGVVLVILFAVWLPGLIGDGNVEHRRLHKLLT